MFNDVAGLRGGGDLPSGSAAMCPAVLVAWLYTMPLPALADLSVSERRRSLKTLYWATERRRGG